MLLPVSAVVRVRRQWRKSGIEIIVVLSGEVKSAVLIIILLCFCCCHVFAVALGVLLKRHNQDLASNPDAIQCFQSEVNYDTIRNT